MCIGVPALITAVDGWDATADLGGTILDVNVMLLEDISPGEHVLIHAGYAISKVDEVQAAQITEYLKAAADGGAPTGVDAEEAI